VGSLAILFGFALYAATIFAIHRWIDAIPARLVAHVERERAHGEQRALDTLRVAAGERVAKLVLSLRDYEEQTAAAVRARAAAESARTRLAEGRAQAADRDMGEAVTALTAASALVAQLREILDRLPPVLPAAPAEDPADPQERRTIELKRPPLEPDDDEPEEEPTKITPRPGQSGLWLAARPGFPPSPGRGAS
jgi:hypothetical protein